MSRSPRLVPTSVLAGNVVSYFVTVSNAGPATATNVLVEDTLPAGLVLQAADGVCGAGFPCTIPAIPPGENLTTRIDLLVPENYAGPRTIANTASAQTSSDPDSANNTATATTRVIDAQADLAITKVAPSSVAPGGLITYDVTIVNNGPSVAQSVVLLDVLPGGTTFVSIQAPPTSVCETLPSGESGVIRCRTPTLAAGSSLVYQVVVQANADLVAGSTLTNVAVASSPTPDLNLTNDRARTDTRRRHADRRRSRAHQERCARSGSHREHGHLHAHRRQSRTGHGHQCHADRHAVGGPHAGVGDPEPGHLHRRHLRARLPRGWRRRDDHARRHRRRRRHPYQCGDCRCRGDGSRAGEQPGGGGDDHVGGCRSGRPRDSKRSVRRWPLPGRRSSTSFA